MKIYFLRKMRAIVVIVVVAFVTLVSFVTSENAIAAFVVDYYKHRDVKQIVSFACWHEFDVYNYYRYLNNADLRTSYVRIGDEVNMKKALKVNYYKLGIVLDLDCPQSNIVFDQFSAAKLPFNDSYLWLFVSSTEDVPTRILGKLPLTVESELTLALVQKSKFILYDVYNHGYRHGGKLNVTSMGHWDATDGLKNYLTQYKYKRRQDFHGMTLNFSVALASEPKPDLETYLTVPINPHLDPMSRFHYNLVLQLRDFYNFKINLARTNSWGYLINGTFNGILGDMIKGIVDVSVSPLYYKKERISVCEYTVQTYVVKTCFIFRHPKKNALRNPFLKPFTQDVWFVSLNVGIVCWILLLIIAKIENYYNPDKSEKLHGYPTSETALMTVAAVSQQGSSDELHLYSGRIAFLTLFVWTLMMYQFYSADIVGSLIAAPPKFIVTLKDLVDSNLFLATEDIPYTHDYYRTTKDPVSIYLWEKKLKPTRKRKTFVNAIDGLREVSKGGYAFFVDTATGYKIIEDTFTQAQICDLSEIPVIPPMTVSLVTSKHSPFKKMVVYGLRKIVEHGLAKRLTFIWQNRKPNCPESFLSQPVPVELQEFSPAMFLVVGGLILATVVMTGERLSTRYRRRVVASEKSLRTQSAAVNGLELSQNELDSPSIWSLEATS